MKFFFLLFLSFFLFWISGCNEEKLAERSFEENLKGIWVLTEESRQLVRPHLQNVFSQLIINEEGTFSFSQMPSDSKFLKEKGFVSGEGNWRISSENGRYQLNLEFREITDPKGMSAPFGTQIYLSGPSRTTTLFYFYGDPDEGVRIEFEKK